MNVLAFLAHHDDETLLCGGLLHALMERGHKIMICIATGVRYENARDDAAEETERQARRIQAFNCVCSALKAQNLTFAYPQNVKIAPEAINAVFAFHKPDLLITHGKDTGHQRHNMVRLALQSGGWTTKQPTIYTWKGAADPIQGDCPPFPIKVPIQLIAKQLLLEYYRHGTTRTPEWRPEENPGYAPWIGPDEYYAADQSVVEWWASQFPDIVGGI